jgi:hypothetical protein
MSEDLSIAMTEMLEYVPIIYSASNVMFEIIFFKKPTVAGLVGISLGVINAVLPM